MKRRIRTKEKGPKIDKVKWKNGDKVKISWKFSGKVTGYKVQYSRNPKFKKEKTHTLLKKKKKAVIKGLKAGKKYYIRVCAYKKSKGKITWKKWGHKVIVQRKK